MAPSGHCRWGLARAPPDWNWFTWSNAQYYVLKFIKETKNFDSIWLIRTWQSSFRFRDLSDLRTWPLSVCFSCCLPWTKLKRWSAQVQSAPGPTSTASALGGASPGRTLQLDPVNSCKLPIFIGFTMVKMNLWHILSYFNMKPSYFRVSRLCLDSLRPLRWVSLAFSFSFFFISTPLLPHGAGAFAQQLLHGPPNPKWPLLTATTSARNPGSIGGCMASYHGHHGQFKTEKMSTYVNTILEYLRILGSCSQFWQFNLRRIFLRHIPLEFGLCLMHLVLLRRSPFHIPAAPTARSSQVALIYVQAWP